MQNACRLNCLHNGINLIVICFKFCCKYNDKNTNNKFFLGKIENNFYL